MYFWERTGMIEADSSEAFGKACYELKTESTKERSPTELRCASFPTRLSVRWGAVKGQDERPLFEGALDSSPPHHRRVIQMERWNGKQLIRKAATSALTFMTFS
jgi:hypothetical protein